MQKLRPSGWDLCCHPAFPKGEVTCSGSLAAAPDLGQSLLTPLRTMEWPGQLSRHQPPRPAPPRRARIRAGVPRQAVSPNPQAAVYLLIAPPFLPGGSQTPHSFLCLADGENEA